MYVDECIERDVKSNDCIFLALLPLFYAQVGVSLRKVPEKLRRDAWRRRNPKKERFDVLFVFVITIIGESFGG